MKNKKKFSCTQCGASYQKWNGQCPECLAWNTIEEDYSLSNANGISTDLAINGKILKVEYFDNKLQEYSRYSSGFIELDRVLGGGIVPGSAILIGGEPGIGKSTLLLQLAATVNDNVAKAMYVTGEESLNQVKLRASRLNLLKSKVSLLTATNVSDLIATICKQQDKVELLVVDSIQTMVTDIVSSAAGTVSQIKAASHQLIEFAKRNNICLILVGHVTKEGQIAGPKLLEHMVDSVLYFEGDNNLNFRIIRSIKNRFGPTGEIAVFKMLSEGVKEVLNPSELFLLERKGQVSGVCVFASLEGTRPILVEVQALVAPSNMTMPRRSVVGWDANRLSMILAILAVRLNLNLSNFEVYLNIAGGLKINEPGVDLAVACALMSAAKNKPLEAGSIVFGELGLSGEIRAIPGTEMRVKEAIKLGFKTIIMPKIQDADSKAMTMVAEKAELRMMEHILQLKL